MIAQSYYAVYTDLIDEDYFGAGRGTFEVSTEHTHKSTPIAHPDITPARAIGPEYTKDATEEAIRHRYERILKLIPFTLRRLRQQQDFRGIVLDRRKHGWKDWHILSALFTAVINYRAHVRFGADMTVEQLNEHTLKSTTTPETKKAKAVPLSAVTKEQLEFCRQVNLVPVLHSWGLERPHPAMMPGLIEGFLSTRYQYWVDDVEHEAIFSV